MGVILDVVYNHLGPDDCYHHAFSNYYPHRKRPGNDWGDSLNFDGPKSGPVREYFIANAGYWIAEYHLDGLRLDATQAIHDDSKEHIIAAVSRHAREAAGKRSDPALRRERAPERSPDRAAKSRGIWAGRPLER